MCLLDAPISGGIARAETGELTFMVGGAIEDFNRAKPILMEMGKNIFHVGESGAGSALKLCNNMLAATSLIAVCEAYNLAAKLGIDAQTFYDVISVSTGQCYGLTHYCPFPGPVPSSPANHNYEASAAVNIILKDLKLSQAVAQEASVATPLGSLTTALYEMLNQQGFGAKDLAIIIKMLAGTINEHA
jgi:3-hydroxyisobutyrate dehydrogenase